MKRLVTALSRWLKLLANFKLRISKNAFAKYVLRGVAAATCPRIGANLHIFLKTSKKRALFAAFSPPSPQNYRLRATRPSRLLKLRRLQSTREITRHLGNKKFKNSVFDFVLRSVCSNVAAIAAKLRGTSVIKNIKTRFLILYYARFAVTLPLLRRNYAAPR